MARPASLSTAWLPTYAWWPPPEQFDVTAILTPYHVTTDPEAVYEFVLRGYAGSEAPAWEHDVGRVAFGEQRAVRLADLELPAPPVSHGGILEVHGVRIDQPPRQGIGFNAMWIDAHGPDGGGYVIPTIPSRAQGKLMTRDDLQVVPGIVVSRETDTEVVMLNVAAEATSVKLVVVGPDGLSTEGAAIEVAPWSAWRGNVSRHVRGATRLLSASQGVGSLAIYSSHKIIPYFAVRQVDGLIGSLDHAAPIFAVKAKKAPRLSAVILAEGTEDDLGRCLDELRRQSQAARVEVEAIVVGSEGGKGSSERARREGLRVESVLVARGHGHALNRGIAAASGRYVAFLDDRHTPPGDGWIWQLLTAMEKDNLVAAQGRRVARGGVDTAGRYLHDRAQSEATDEPDFAPGGVVLAVRRKIAEQTPFAEDGDEPERAWLAEMALGGRRVASVPGVVTPQRSAAAHALAFAYRQGLAGRGRENAVRAEAGELARMGRRRLIPALVAFEGARRAGLRARSRRA